jgi:cysteine-rich repeat protein
VGGSTGGGPLDGGGRSGSGAGAFATLGGTAGTMVSGAGGVAGARAGGAGGRGGSGGQSEGGTSGDAVSGGTAGGGMTGGVGGVASGCGDGNVDMDETCDDGNRTGGDGCSPRCRPEPVAIRVGESFACALSNAGTVKCWGMNQRAQLGIGSTMHRGDQPDELGEALPFVELGTGRRAVAIDAGFRHACALLDDGSVKCWGDGRTGALGQGDPSNRGNKPGEMGDALPPIALGTGRSARAIAAGGAHTCALLDDGSVKCWGEGGNLGLGDTESRGDGPDEMGDDLPPVDLGTGRTATAIAAGNRHTCALLDDASLRCWGTNNWGALGLGGTGTFGDEPGEMGDALDPVPLADDLSGARIALDDGTAVLFPDGSIKCWGWNDYGQLGDGTTLAQGDDAGEVEELAPVDLPLAKAVALGWGWKCALLHDDSVICWGLNHQGQLGLGDEKSRGDEPGELDDLRALDLGTGRSAVAIDAGGTQSCALLDDASVKCWGSGNLGALGTGDSVDRGDDPGEMGDTLPAVDLVF